MIQWSIGLQEGEGGNYATRVPKTNHPGRANAALHMTLQVHKIPANYAGPGAEAPHADQAQPGILGREMGRSMHSQQYSKACDAERHPEDDKGIAKPDRIGQVCCNQAETQRRGEGDYGMELCLYYRITKCLYDCWREIG